MSIKLMTKAWDTDQKGNDLLVLLAMCDYASDEGILFPSLKTLGAKSKVSKSTLAYILNAYESIGVITRDKRKRDNGSNTSTQYQINHLDINLEEYKKAYQEARNYTKKPQCGQGQEDKKVEIVDKENDIVDKGNSNCGQLEPSTLNHHSFNHHLKTSKKESVIKIKDIISYYSENISSLQAKIKEKAAIHEIAMIPKDERQEVLAKVLVGLEHFSEALPEKIFITNLEKFIGEKIYLDYQEPVVQALPNSNQNNNQGPTVTSTIARAKAMRERFRNNENNDEILDGEVS